MFDLTLHLRKMLDMLDARHLRFISTCIGSALEERQEDLDEVVEEELAANSSGYVMAMSSAPQQAEDTVRRLLGLLPLFHGKHDDTTSAYVSLIEALAAHVAPASSPPSTAGHAEGDAETVLIELACLLPKVLRLALCHPAFDDEHQMRLARLSALHQRHTSTSSDNRSRGALAPDETELDGGDGNHDTSGSGGDVKAVRKRSSLIPLREAPPRPPVDDLATPAMPQVDASPPQSPRRDLQQVHVQPRSQQLLLSPTPMQMPQPQQSQLQQSQYQHQKQLQLQHHQQIQYLKQQQQQYQQQQQQYQQQRQHLFCQQQQQQQQQQ
jgi:hypothetical protein